MPCAFAWADRKFPPAEALVYVQFDALEKAGDLKMTWVVVLNGVTQFTIHTRFTALLCG